MKQNRITKRILAVMMSFLMAFSSIQGYVKAETESMNTENEEEVINVMKMKSSMIQQPAVTLRRKNQLLLILMSLIRQPAVMLRQTQKK